MIKLNGFLIVNKEKGMTSHDVVNKIRKIYSTKSVGHTGTLDPNATGVLCVAVGRATKVIEYLENDDKIYRAELTLGIKTDTEDIWGNIFKEHTVDVNEEEIIHTIKTFIGKQKQVPPMYSALKVNGKKLYELAREGQEIERVARDIEIFDISDIVIKGCQVLFTVHCSKGTYIRTLCKDIGEKLGCGAVMSGLNRIKAGIFDIKEAHTLTEITENSEGLIVDIEKPLEKFQIICLEEESAKKYVNGIRQNVSNLDGKYRIYIDNRLYGIGEVANFTLKSVKKII